MLSVAVFAHNEEAAISEAMQAIVAAGLGPEDRVTVLVNGTGDRTLEKVAAFSATDPRFSAIDIALGDKANAWDMYVQRLAPADAEAHVFIDGDVRVSEGAFAHMRKALDEYPEALALSALPRGGRQSEGWARSVVKNHGLPGNFYALRGTLVARMRDKFWLPVGLIGDDTFVRLMVLRDLDPLGEPVRSRIHPLPDAYFDYESIPFTSFRGLTALWKRQKRYALREAQIHMLMRRLRSNRHTALPRRIDAIYEDWRFWSDGLRAYVGFGPRRMLIPLMMWPARHSVGRDLGKGVWYQED